MQQKHIINTQSELETLVLRASETDAVGIDTEFVWERTYYPKLGLIQIALSNEECFAVDPLAIPDLSPLGRLLANPEIVKIFHDAPQDLNILRQACGNITPVNIFDTRLAAGFAGSISTISLEKLVKEQLDTDLDKSASRTNWLKRPLTDQQITYCLDDVRYLRAVRVLLLERVIGSRIKTWLYDELDRLNDPANYAPIADDKRYSRIKGIYKLPAKGVALAKKLSIWREEKARSLDRPRGHVISDDVIFDICDKSPKNEDELRATTISMKAIDRYQLEILAICTESTTDPKETLTTPTDTQLTTKEKQILKDLKKLISLKGDILGIDPPLIGNTKELRKVVKHIADKKIKIGRQETGWRKEFLAEFLDNQKKVK